MRVHVCVCVCVCVCMCICVPRCTRGCVVHGQTDFAPFATVSSPGVTVVLQWCSSSDVTVVIHVVLQWCYSGITDSVYSRQFRVLVFIVSVRNGQTRTTGGHTRQTEILTKDRRHHSQQMVNSRGTSKDQTNGQIDKKTDRTSSL
jgi:hypothetical protein